MTPTVLVASLVAAAVLGAEGQAWSSVGARTVGLGNRVAEGTVGWPAVALGYRWGAMAQLDVGGRVGFVYGQEGLVSRVLPGVKAQGLVTWRAVDAERVSFAVSFDPGVFVNVDRIGVSYVGIGLPVGLKLGLAASSAVGLGLTFDVPLWILLGNGGGLNVPLLPGLGGEYFISSDLAVFVRMRMGPTLRQRGAAEFTLDAQLGAAWKL